MTDDRDTRFEPKPRRKGGGQNNEQHDIHIPKGYIGFLNGLTRDMAIAKVTSGRSSARKPNSPRTGRFNSRGRGRAALERGIGPRQGWVVHRGNRYRARRAVVKVRVVKLRGARLGVARGHMAYLQREEGVERVEGLDGTSSLTPTQGKLYGPDPHVSVDGRDFINRTERSFKGLGDPHQFRIMLSPEDGAELARVNAADRQPNLQETTRELMSKLEKDLGTHLDWVAVDHFDTAHPHTHIVARGITHDGKGLHIAGDYISHGIRGRLEEHLTQELGWKNEKQILREMERDLDAQRVTSVDRTIQKRMDPMNGTIDLRAGSVAADFQPHSSMNRHVLMGRMKHLEKMKLATVIDKGCWQLKGNAFGTLHEIAERASLSRSIHAAMKRVGINRPIRLDGGRDGHGKIIGRVIGKGLAGDEGMGPEKGTKARLIIDGHDGYVRAIETGLETRAGEATKIGSIVEIGQAKLRRVDRSIRDQVKEDGTFGLRKLWNSLAKQRTLEMTDRKLKAEMRVHSRRMETLTKAGIAVPDGKNSGGDTVRWRLPADFETQALKLDIRQGRATGIEVLSVQELDAQLASEGATWLDRSQITWLNREPMTRGFGADIYDAVSKRQSWLIEQGLAEKESNGRVSYKQGFTKTLAERGIQAEISKLETSTGKSHLSVMQGMMVEGTYTMKIETPQGPKALVETQRAFYLVPWRSVMEQTLGKRIHGRVQGGGGIDWELGRGRGIGR